MEYKQELENVRRKIIDAFLLGTMIFIFPALTASILRILEIGWHYIFLFHIIGALIVIIIYVFRKQLSLRFKVHALSVLTLFQSMVALLSFRIVGLGILIVISVLLPTLIYGRKQGILYSLFYIVCFVLIAFLHINGVIGTNVDFNLYSNNIFTWLNYGIGCIFVFAIIIYSISSFYQLFTKNLEASIEKTFELTNSYNEIKFQEERFDHFMDAFPYPVTIKDENLRYVYGNKALQKLTNLDFNQLIGMEQNRVYPPDLAKQLDSTDIEVLQTNQSVRTLLNGELNNSMLYFELIKFPLSDTKGQKLIGSITIDRTEQRLAELKLIESEQTFRSLFTKAADGISLIYEERFVDCNQSVFNQLGYGSFDDIIGKTPWDLSPEYQPDGLTSKEKAAQMIALCFQNGHHGFDWVHSKKNGEYIFFSIMLTPIAINNKQIIYCVWRDITERYKTREALKESENKYRSIFEGSIDGFIFMDREKQIIECNQSFCKLLKYEKQDLLKLSMDQIMHGKWEEVERQYFNSEIIIESGNTGVFEMEFIDRGNKLVPVELNIHKLAFSDNYYYWAVVRDILERKQMEKANFGIMVSSEEKERARYAKELHDGLGPILSTSMIYLHTMRDETDREKLKEYIDRTYVLIDEAVVSIREISNNLSPEILIRYGLVQAIRSFIEKLKHVSDIEFAIHSNLDCRLPDIVEFTIYRTLIELVNNSIKHANANKIRIEIEKIEEALSVKFSDDGRGYDYAKNKDSSKGFGMMNMERRIMKIDGQFHYVSTPGKGVFVEIKLNTGSI